MEHEDEIAATAKEKEVNWKQNGTCSHDVERTGWLLLCSGVPQKRIVEVLKATASTLPIEFKWLASQRLVDKMSDSFAAFALDHACKSLTAAKGKEDVLSGTCLLSRCSARRRGSMSTSRASRRN